MLHALQQCYIDNAFCIMEKMHIQPFMEYLNSLHPTIRFAMEQVKDFNPVEKSYVMYEILGSSGLHLHQRDKESPRDVAEGTQGGNQTRRA